MCVSSRGGRTNATIWLVVTTTTTLLLFTAAKMDNCHGDLSVVNRPNPGAKCNRPTLLITLKKLHGNPYHALHDTIWAVTHYLISCVRSPKHTHIFVNTTMTMHLSLCENEPTQYNRSIHPFWGVCMVRYAAIVAGISPSHFHIAPQRPSICYTSETKFGRNFRDFAYRVIPVGKPTPRPRPHLSSKFCERALRYLAAAPHRLFSRRELRLPRSSSVRILLYDRADVRRRRWANSGEIAHTIALDPRVKLRHIAAMPRAVIGQARLFQWPDILITPHGAGLANSLFLAPGAEIIEVWKCCRDDVRPDPWMARKWTGWHAHRMGLKLRYLQCHETRTALSIKELEKDEHVNASDRLCSLRQFYVEEEDALTAVREAIPRQMKRIAKLQRQHWLFWLPNFIFLISAVILGGRVLMWRMNQQARNQAGTSPRVP